MGILMAVLGCTVASSEKDYGIQLPPINASTTGVGNRFVTINSQGTETNYISVNLTGSSSTYTWNPENYPRSLFQTRLVYVSGSTEATGTYPFGEWFDSDVNWQFRWDQDSVGTSSTEVRLEIRLKSTGKVLATRGVSVELRKQSYGITLPSTLNLTSTGTTNRSIRVTTGLPNAYSLQTNRNGTLENHIWNPNLYPPSLFDVRMVNVSGSAPSGGTAWQRMDAQRAWEWVRSTVGVTSGATRLEIREVATGTVLAQSNISATLNMQASYSDHTVTVGYVRDQPDPKVTINRYGFNRGSGMGAVSPGSFRGSLIQDLSWATLFDMFTFAIQGEYPQNYLSRIEIGGQTLLGSSATTFSNQSGYTRWTWGGIEGGGIPNPFGNVGTQQNVRIHY